MGWHEVHARNGRVDWDMCCDSVSRTFPTSIPAVRGIIQEGESER